MKASLDPVSVVAAIRSLLSNAARTHEEVTLGQTYVGFEYMGEEEVISCVEKAFLELIMVTEALGLTSTHALVMATYREAQRVGLYDSFADPDGELHLTWYSPLRRLTDSLGAVLGLRKPEMVRRDLVDILKATQYSIADKDCFGGPPRGEPDVHRRIEAVLRCVFPDLMHEPALAKPMKNFVPDTGLPSIRTLIEYKFVDKAAKVAEISDEILADTCGYHSPEWRSFVYVIYETQRFRSEKKWNQHLEQCRGADNTQAVVICGESPSRTGRRAKPKKRKSHKRGPTR